MEQSWKKIAISVDAPNSANVIHVVEIFQGTSIVGSSMESYPKAKNKRDINRQYTYVQSALFPKPKDSWGLFGKPHFRNSTCFSLPAAHWLRQELVFWNPSQHLVLAGTCQINSRVNSCLGATVWLPPSWTKKQNWTPSRFCFSEQEDLNWGKAMKSEKCLPAENLDQCSYSFLWKPSESLGLSTVGCAGSQTDSELGREPGKAHRLAFASGQTYAYLQLRVFFSASILKTVVNLLTFQRRVTSCFTTIFNKKVLCLQSTSYPPWRLSVQTGS